MTNDGSYVYERQLSLFDDGGTGSDRRRFVTWNAREKQNERYYSQDVAQERADDLNETGGAK